MAKDDKPTVDIAALRAFPAGIWTLGLVSLLMDISSEMIHALLPVYLVTVLGISTLAVGVIEELRRPRQPWSRCFRAPPAFGWASGRGWPSWATAWLR
jgi:hypothetical protein